MKTWCRHSLTIAWARLQTVGGLIGSGLIIAFSGYDLTQLASLDARSVFKMLLMLAISGILTELARRRSLPDARKV